MSAITFEQRIERLPGFPIVDEEMVNISINWSPEKNLKTMNFAITNFFDIAKITIVIYWQICLTQKIRWIPI